MNQLEVESEIDLGIVQDLEQGPSRNTPTRNISAEPIRDPPPLDFYLLPAFMILCNVFALQGCQYSASKLLILNTFIYIAWMVYAHYREHHLGVLCCLFLCTFIAMSLICYTMFYYNCKNLDTKP
jgi:hypothetical protein